MLSTTFNRPPLDGSLSIPELYDWHYIHNADYPLFVFEEAPGSLRTICMGEGVQGIHRATDLVRKEVELAAKKSEEKHLVIAVLSASDSIALFCTILGVLRTGNRVFPISPRESPEAVAFLLSEGKADYVIVSPESAVQKLAEKAIALSNRPDPLKRLKMPLFNQLFPGVGFDPDFKPVPASKHDMNAIASIYHSSGTTSFPKPVYWSHKALLAIAVIPTYGETDLSTSLVACHCIPIFHGMGMIPLAFPATVGMRLSVFKPQVPAIAPNPTNVFQGAVMTKSEYLLAPPVFLETWSQNPDCVNALAKMRGIMYGGGPLDKGAGDLLASKGVSIFQTYACIQTALLSEVLPRSPGMDWDYFRITPNRAIHLKDHGNNEFEIIVLSTGDYKPNVINTQVNGIDAYATSDMVSPHPTREGYLKIIGRTDDQIIHSTGEKTNPGPLEGIFAQDPLIESAVIFGRGRFQCGVIVQPSQGNTFDPSDTEKLIQYRKAIWPTVEKVNARAATHSRIFIEMILVASPSKPFQYTSKGNLRRQHMINSYSAEIDELYASIAESAQEDIVGPSNWTPEETCNFVKSVVAHTLKTESTSIGEDDDLFEHGLDSLQATWIRNTIIRVLRSSKSELANKVSTNFVYDNPTIKGLTDYLQSTITGKSQSNGTSILAKKTEIQALVEKYSKGLPNFRQPEGGGEDVVVLLTGSTGVFGSNILAALLSNPSISRVYSVSRSSSSASLQDRLIAAFAKDGLKEELLRSTKLELFEGDLSRPDFGLTVDSFVKLQRTTTHIIHNAWRVDFNLSLSSFEANIRSVRNLIDFSLGGAGPTPAHLLFISSIGVFTNYSGTDVVKEEMITEPDSSIGTGYGESKWVAERILKIASEEATDKSLKVTVVRPGQMTGGPGGAWSTHEWFPSLIKSSIFLGKLPMVSGSISWLPSDIAAAALLDMMNSDEMVLHLVHPRPVSWSTIINAFAEELGLPVVPYEEWLNELEESSRVLESAERTVVDKQLEQNPALRLLSFFAAARMRHGDDVEPLGVPKLATEKATRASLALRSARQIDREDVVRWLRFWKSNGFIRGEHGKKGDLKRGIDQLL